MYAFPLVTPKESLQQWCITNLAEYEVSYSLPAIYDCVYHILLSIKLGKTDWKDLIETGNEMAVRLMFNFYRNYDNFSSALVRYLCYSADGIVGIPKKLSANLSPILIIEGKPDEDLYVMLLNKSEMIERIKSYGMLTFKDIVKDSDGKEKLRLSSSN